MTQVSARTKTIVFGVLGLVVFTVPVLYTLSQRSETSKDSGAGPAPATWSEQKLLRGPVTLSDEQIMSLTEPYMAALFQARQTGNYEPLYSLGAPDFQQKNSPDKLQQIFSNFWEQNAGLSPNAQSMPRQSSKPYFDEKGMLHLTGYYPTEPLQLHYDLALQSVDGVWRLFGISVKTVPVS